MPAPTQHRKRMSQAYANSHLSGSFTQRIFFLPIVSLAMVSSQGCSVYLAAHQPDQKDLTVLERGTPRQNVAAELGDPIWSEDRNKSTI